MPTHSRPPESSILQLQIEGKDSYRYIFFKALNGGRFCITRQTHPDTPLGSDDEVTTEGSFLKNSKLKGI